MRPTEERAGSRLRDAGAEKWKREKSKSCAQKVGCAAAARKGRLEGRLKESTRRAIKYRRDSNIIIVIHEGRGWFDPLSPAKGDVFSLAEHLGAGGFAEACDRVADVVGFVPSCAGLARPQGRRRSRPSPSGWAYTVQSRGPARASLALSDRRARIPDGIIAAAVVARSAARGSAGQHVGGAQQIRRRASPAGRSVARLARVRHGRDQGAVSLWVPIGVPANLHHRSRRSMP